jgi:nucleotide-binding universal stress UspA family protein
MLIKNHHIHCASNTDKTVVRAVQSVPSVFIWSRAKVILVRAMYERILVGTDGSEYARAALDSAIGFAKIFGSKLLIVTAFTGYPDPKAPVADAPPPLYMSAEVRDRVSTVLRRAKERAEIKGVEAVETKLLLTADNPGVAIVKAAEESGTSLIVVGSRGLTGIKRILLGSVASYVAEYAGCDVHIARA